MKRIYLLLLVMPLLWACSDSNDNEPTQDYTSFTFEHHENTTLVDCIAAYLDGNNHYIKIADLGDLGKDDISKEVTLSDAKITSIHLFTIDTKLNAIYSLQKNKKNKIVLDRNTGGIRITDKSDPTQYPQ